MLMKVRSKTQTILVREKELTARQSELRKLGKIPSTEFGEIFERAELMHKPAPKIKDAILTILDLTGVKLGSGFGSSFESTRNIGQILKRTKTEMTIVEVQRLIFDILRYMERECYFAYEQKVGDEMTAITPAIIVMEEKPQIIRLHVEESDPSAHIEVLDDYSLKAVELIFEAKAIVDEALGYRAENIQNQSRIRIKIAEDELFKMQMRQAGKLIGASEKLWPHTQRRLDFDRYRIPQGEIMGINRIVENMEAPHLLDIDIFEETVSGLEVFDPKEVKKIVRMSRELFLWAAKEPKDIKNEIN